jgi:DNA-binding response OmpR family regulator
MKTPNQLETTAERQLEHLNGQPAPDPQTNRQTILLVEDDRALRRYLEVVLQKAGYTVITAGDGLEAMKVALTTPLSAVVTDAIMPHLGGHELCRFLRCQSKLSHLPIIILSGHESTPPPAEDAANIYMTKPVKPNELINCLERLL